MGLEVPKQFALVRGKPVLVYTIEAFERHPSIDSIGVVCVDGWHSVLHDYCARFEITKVDWVISGGETAQESIHLGLRHLAGRIQDNDTVVIHDGNRPLVDADVISDVLATCYKYGNGVASLPYNEQIFQIDAEEPYSTIAYIPRDTLRRVSTPQAYHYAVITKRYREAAERGIGFGPSSYANTLMVEMGERLYFAAGSDLNIKLTTPEDLELFRARLAMLADIQVTPI